MYNSKSALDLQNYKEVAIGTVFTFTLYHNIFCLLKYVGMNQMPMFRVLPWSGMYVPNQKALEDLNKNNLLIDGVSEFAVFVPGGATNIFDHLTETGMKVELNEPINTEIIIMLNIDLLSEKIIKNL